VQLLGLRGHVVAAADLPAERAGQAREVGLGQLPPLRVEEDHPGSRPPTPRPSLSAPAAGECSLGEQDGSEEAERTSSNADILHARLVPIGASSAAADRKDLSRPGTGMPHLAATSSTWGEKKVIVHLLLQGR